MKEKIWGPAERAAQRKVMREIKVPKQDNMFDYYSKRAEDYLNEDEMIYLTKEEKTCMQESILKQCTPTGRNVFDLYNKKTAKEMFAELGYGLKKDNSNFITYIKEDINYGVEYTISFDKVSKITYLNFYDYVHGTHKPEGVIHYKEFKAIQQQIIELEW